MPSTLPSLVLANRIIIGAFAARASVFSALDPTALKPLGLPKHVRYQATLLPVVSRSGLSRCTEPPQAVGWATTDDIARSALEHPLPTRATAAGAPEAYHRRADPAAADDPPAEPLVVVLRYLWRIAHASASAATTSPPWTAAAYARAMATESIHSSR